LNITPSGFVLTRPDILGTLRQEAARNRIHRKYAEDAIIAFEKEGPHATPPLNGCQQNIARLILDEVAQAYDRAERAARDAASTTTAVRDIPQPYTAHRRGAVRRALYARQMSNAHGLDRLRVCLTIG
jgi:hypothetical protein